MEYIEILRKKIGKENIYLSEPMSKHTSFRVGGCADAFVKIDSVEKLKTVLMIAKENKVPVTILGNGSNLLVRDKGIRGIVCKIEITKLEIQEENEDEIFVTVGSGNKNGELSQKLLNLEIEGFEFASRNSRNNWWCN